MAMSVVSMHLRQRGPAMVLWLAPTKELVGQAARDFQSAWKSHGDVPAVVLQWYDGGERFTSGTIISRNTVLVASIQITGQSVSADSWIEKSLRERVSLVVFDEAHRSVAPTSRKLVENIVTANESERPLLGLSATPGRASPEESRELVSMFRQQKIGIGDDENPNPIRFLVKKKYLARANIVTRTFEGSLTPSPEGQDYSDEALKRLGEDVGRNRVIVEIVLDLLENNHKRVIVFTPSVSSAIECAKMVQDTGYQHSYAVSGETQAEARNHYIRNFSAPISDAPSPRVIFNCNVLTAGFDAPEISAAVIGRPTKSAVLLQQMIGRALRGPLSNGTEEAEIRMVVDHTFEGYVNLAELFCKWESLWDPPGVDPIVNYQN